MPAPAAKSVPILTEEAERAQRIFARLMAGDSIRAIAASESLSVRRVQQIVRERLDRRDSNPADDDERIMLTDAAGRSLRRELIEFIRDLDVDEAAALVPLAWIGRGRPAARGVENRRCAGERAG